MTKWDTAEIEGFQLTLGLLEVALDIANGIALLARRGAVEVFAADGKADNEIRERGPELGVRIFQCL